VKAPNQVQLPSACPLLFTGTSHSIITDRPRKTGKKQHPQLSRDQGQIVHVVGPGHRARAGPSDVEGVRRGRSRGVRAGGLGPGVLERIGRHLAERRQRGAGRVANVEGHGAARVVLAGLGPAAEVVLRVGLEGHGLVEPGLGRGSARRIRDRSRADAAVGAGGVDEAVGQRGRGGLDGPRAGAAFKVAVGDDVGGRRSGS